MTKIRQQLENEVELWGQMHIVALAQRFVLRNGRECIAQRKPAGIRHGMPKQCFKNSTHLLLSRRAVDGDWRYTEGYAATHHIGLLVHHAWLTDAEGRVIDPTWPDSETAQYFGVLFDRPTVLMETVERRVYGLLDTGRGYNRDLMYRLDPALESIITGLRAQVPA